MNRIQVRLGSRDVGERGPTKLHALLPQSFQSCCLSRTARAAVSVALRAAASVVLPELQPDLARGTEMLAGDFGGQVPVACLDGVDKFPVLFDS